jgi:hypothetical protein
MAVMGQGSAPPPIDRVNTERQRQQEMSNREYKLRNLGNEPGGPADDREKKALMAQVEQDFNRILLLHNQIVRAIKSDAPLDYGFLFDASGEIKKRSTRLQATLVLGQTTEEKEQSPERTEFDKDQMKPELLTLCKHIKNFVTNPIIETPGTVDAVNLEKAKRDLANIINLSGLIRKHADQLRR